jgi:hypothetical protein
MWYTATAPSWMVTNQRRTFGSGTFGSFRTFGSGCKMRMMPLLLLGALALAFLSHASAAATAPAPPPPVDQNCQARLDSWCNCAAHCSAGFPQYAPLAALFGLNRHNTSKAWRCYPVSELNADRSAFLPDPERSTDHICTEPEHLPEQLKLCGQTPPAPAPDCPSSPPRAPLPLLPGVSFITRVFVGGTGMKISRDSGRSWGAASVLPFSADPEHNSLHRAQTVFDAKTDAVFLFDDALPYPTTKHVRQLTRFIYSYNDI